MSRSLGILLGVTADALLGDPRRGHPVALFGTWAAGLERRLYSCSVPRGAAFVAVAIAPMVALGVAAESVTSRRPLAHTLVTAAATWAVLGARSLVAEGLVMADRLDAGDLTGAREQLPHLCGRRPDGLAAPELARASVESLAENANDAVVASLFWGALAGVPGLLGHRAVNTLDAMVGYHNPRYEHFGRPAARLDDALAYVPARLTGLLACAAAPLAGESTAGAWRALWRDHAHHPSPNGGWCEAAWAGALGVRLGGTNVYGDRVETRGTLGEPGSSPPAAADLRAAAHLLVAVTASAAGLAAATAGFLGGRRCPAS